MAFFLVVSLAVVVFIAKGVRVVPNATVYIIERLGKYHATLNAGLNFIIPFIDKVAYKHTFKEQTLDIEEQVCITQDNVQVEVDGLLYLQVLNPKSASYGIEDYKFAIEQLAQTAMRSEIGKLELDKTFESRDTLNKKIIEVVDGAAQKWGVKALRYEIKGITPPKNVLQAMEKQMQAEREKGAQILLAEGERESLKAKADGEKQYLEKTSEGEKAKQINESEGQARAIENVAKATAGGLKELAKAINEPGGNEALQLQVAKDLIKEFGNLAKETNTMILPANFAEPASLIAMATSVIKQQTKASAK